MNLTVEKAKEIYPVVPDSFKRELEKEFGVEMFMPDNLDELTDYEAALELAKMPDAKKITDIPESLHDYFLKEYKCIVLCKAANQCEKMDIYNSDIRRNYPYFATCGSPSGFRFVGSGYDYSGALAGSGSRLSVKSEKAGKHLGEKFTKEFREMLEA